MMVSSSQSTVWGQPWSKALDSWSFPDIFSLHRNGINRRLYQYYEELSSVIMNAEKPHSYHLQVGHIVGGIIQSNLKNLRRREPTWVCVQGKMRSNVLAQTLTEENRCKFPLFMPFGLFIFSSFRAQCTSWSQPQWHSCVQLLKYSCTNNLTDKPTVVNLASHGPCKFTQATDSHHMHPPWNKGSSHYGE